MPTTITVTDDGNLYNWTEIQRTYDDFGVLTDVLKTFDDGRIFTANWVDGVFVGSMLTDPLDAYTWDSQTVTEWDSPGLGRVRLEVIVYDDGTELSKGYVDGEFVGSFKEDLGNNFAWDTIEINMAGNGLGQSVLVQEITYDDGVTYLAAWTDGVFSGSYEEDVLDARDWTTIEIQEFDFFGDTIRIKNTVYDDGMVLAQSWTNGVYDGSFQTDPLDAYVWSSIDIDTDDTGAVEQKTITYDSTDVRVEIYDAGNKVAVHDTDGDDDKYWSDLWTVFEDDGDLAGRKIVEDDGDELISIYLDDQIVFTQENDVSDSEDWESIETVMYNGVVLQTTTTMDDGSVIVEEFEPIPPELSGLGDQIAYAQSFWDAPIV